MLLCLPLRRCLTHRLVLEVKNSARAVAGGYREEQIDLSQNVKIKELISQLASDERQLLYHQLRNVLLEEEWNKERNAGAEQKPPSNKFLAWLWRGSQHFKTYIEKPSRSQLANLFLYHSLPYVAFGFMDNSIMILAGDYIEATIGARLGLSTMGSAALGNAMADAVSIAMAYQVERFFTRLVQGPSTLTLSQFELKRTRVTIQLARIIGIACGCLLGMLPLLFISKSPSVH